MVQPTEGNSIRKAVAPDSAEKPRVISVKTGNRKPTHAQRVQRLLGHRPGKGKGSLEQLMQEIRTGLPYRDVDHLIKTLGLSGAEWSMLFGVSRSPMMRHAKQPAEPMKKEVSDRAYRVAAVAAKAEDVLGDPEAAKGWLHKPSRALGGLTPIDQMDTDVGVRAVEAILDRIDYGVYS